MTPGQRWRMRRDMALAVLILRGMSNGMAADIFDLDPAAVSRIVKRFKVALKGSAEEILTAALKSMGSKNQRAESRRRPESAGNPPRDRRKKSTSRAPG